MHPKGLCFLDLETLYVIECYLQSAAMQSVLKQDTANRTARDNHRFSLKSASPSNIHNSRQEAQSNDSLDKATAEPGIWATHADKCFQQECSHAFCQGSGKLLLSFAIFVSNMWIYYKQTVHQKVERRLQASQYVFHKVGPLPLLVRCRCLFPSEIPTTF